MKTSTHVFKTFPEFSPLTLADRDRYNVLIASYPPYSDIAFAGLMTRWSMLEECRVSQLNGNLIISYWFPGFEEISGLSIVGTQKVDETICALFDHQLAKGEQARLVHVPEFVIGHLNYPDMFTFKDERKLDECILTVDSFINPKNITKKQWEKLSEVLSQIEKSNITVDSLDLNQPFNKRLLLKSSEMWEKKGMFNDLGKYEKECFIYSIENAQALGFENMCLYVDGELHGFLLYHSTHDSDYAIVSFGRFSYAFPQMFELALYMFMKKFSRQEIKYLNIEADFGIESVKNIKLNLGPANYFRKYTIEPRK